MNSGKPTNHTYVKSDAEKEHTEKQSPRTKRSRSSCTTACGEDKDRPKRPRTAYNFFFRFERDKILGISEASSIDLKSLQRVDKSKRMHRKGTHSLGFLELTARVSAKWKALDVVARAPYNYLAARDMKRYVKQLKEWKNKCKERQYDAKQTQKKEKSNYPQKEHISDISASFQGNQKGSKVVHTQEKSIPDFTKCLPTVENQVLDEKINFGSLKKTDELVVDTIHCDNPPPPLECREERSQCKEMKASKTSKSSKLVPLEILRGDLFSDVFFFLDQSDIKETLLVSTTLRRRLLPLFFPSCIVAGTTSMRATCRPRKIGHIISEGENEQVPTEDLQRDPSDTTNVPSSKNGSCEESMGAFFATKIFPPLPTSSTNTRGVNCGEFESTKNKSEASRFAQLPQKALRSQSQSNTKVDATSHHQQQNQEQERKMNQFVAENGGNETQTRMSGFNTTSSTVDGAPAGKNASTQRPPQNLTPNGTLSPIALHQSAAQNAMVDATRGQNLSERQIIVLLCSRLRDRERQQQETWSMIKQERANHAAARDRMTRKQSMLEEALAIEKQQVIESEREVKNLKTQLQLFQAETNCEHKAHLNPLLRCGRMVRWP